MESRNESTKVSTAQPFSAKRCQFLCLHKFFYVRHLRDGRFQKWADKGLYSCIPFVVVLRV